MNKREKFDLALEMFADIDAVRDGRDMEKIKEFLFEALEDKVPYEATLETTDEYIYVVYMLYKDQASSMEYITDSFESAKNYMIELITDEGNDDGEDYSEKIKEVENLTFEKYAVDYYYSIILDYELGFGFAFSSEKKNTHINNWDLD
jgi:hypothetical protein